MSIRRSHLFAIFGTLIALWLGVSCSDKSRLPSPSQQAVGLYKGEMVIMDEITGDTLESQGGISMRVDPMEPGIVRFSLIKLRFDNIEVGDIYLDANIQRLNDTYLIMSAHNARVAVLLERMVLDVYLNGWQEFDDIHLIIRTTLPMEGASNSIEGVPNHIDVIITYTGRRGG